jgi:hypothetical protein
MMLEKFELPSLYLVLLPKYDPPCFESILSKSDLSSQPLDAESSSMRVVLQRQVLAPLTFAFLSSI